MQSHIDTVVSEICQHTYPADFRGLDVKGGYPCGVSVIRYKDYAIFGGCIGGTPYLGRYSHGKILPTLRHSRSPET